MTIDLKLRKFYVVHNIFSTFSELARLMQDVPQWKIDVSDSDEWKRRSGKRSKKNGVERERKDIDDEEGDKAVEAVDAEEAVETKKGSIDWIQRAKEVYSSSVKAYRRQAKKCCGSQEVTDEATHSHESDG